MTPAMISFCQRLIGEAWDAAYLDGQTTQFPLVFAGQAVTKSNRVMEPMIYGRFDVVPSDETVPVGLGITAKSRNVGLLQLKVYGPKNNGMGVMEDIARDMRKIMHRKDFRVGTEGKLTLKDSNQITMDQVSGEEVYVIVRVPYVYDFMEFAVETTSANSGSTNTGSSGSSGTGPFGGYDTLEEQIAASLGAA